MYIYGESEWVDGWDQAPFWTAVVDLRPCTGQTELIRACAAVLHGRDSAMGGMTNEPNLNWMTDIARDWFIEHWGTKKDILIAGGSRLMDEDPLFALSFVDSVQSAFHDALMAHCQQGESKAVAQESFDTSITLILN